MFKPTRPFKDTVTSHSNEPSLRIGTTVPDDAVNLAYYYNPTASDAEKVLTAEAPKQTIDHRIEDDYRYLFDQVEPDDSLFPEAVYYEDEDGYIGRLGRMWTKWSPEVHTTAKTVEKDETVLVANKGDEPKAIDYSDLEGFDGTLYLDSTDYEVTKTEKRDTYELVEYTVDNYEISLRRATGAYISSAELDSWMTEPTSTGISKWPSVIEVNTGYLATDAGSTRIRSYVSSQDTKDFYGFTGFLVFEKFEYEPVGDGVVTVQGSVSEEKTMPDFKKRDSSWDAILTMTDDQFVEGDSQEDIENAIGEVQGEMQAAIDEIFNSMQSAFPRSCLASYNTRTDEYDYSQIINFINNICPYCDDSGVRSGTHESIRAFLDAMANQGDIAIYRTSFKMANENGHIVCRATYKYKTSTRATLGPSSYNVIAVYSGTLFRNDLVESKDVPVEYAATCHYRGLAKQITYDYDGQAYYRGSVTKGKSMGSVNVETPDELLMFPDKNNVLRRKVEKTDDFGNTELVDFKEVEGEYFWLTDVFSNGEPCFYRYDLKHPVYSFKGADARGISLSNNVDINTSAYRNIPDDYKYAVRLTQRPNDAYMYDAGLYTNFKSWSADTFKATYKPYGENSHITEDIYGYPFLTKEHGYTLLEIEPESRTNAIKMQEQIWFQDTRAYITIQWKVKVERKAEYTSAGVLVKEPFVYSTSEQFSSIINKDYACNCELNLFEDRGYIISPKIDGVRLSPSDMIFRQIALDGIAHEVPIRRADTDLIYSVELTSGSYESSAVNIKCNPDGSGVITAETTVNTGFYNELTGRNDKKLVMDAPYLFEDGYIFPGVMVKCIDSREICIRQPRNDKLLEPWYPIIQFGHYSKVMSQYGNKTKVCYSMPEYNDQRYNDTGRPYIDVNQCECEILNPHMVKVKLFPIYIKTGEANTSVDLFKEIDGALYRLNVKDISFSDGIIITSDVISENDKIVATYTYVEECYTYRGYWRNIDDFLRMDLNPNIYHTYSDMQYLPGKTAPTKNLFNKVVTFFMRPSYVFEEHDPEFSDDSGDNVEIVVNPETGKECYRVIHTEIKKHLVPRVEQEVVGQRPVYRDEPVYATTYYYDYTDLSQSPRRADWQAIRRNSQRYNDSTYDVVPINNMASSFKYDSSIDSLYYEGAWNKTHLNNGTTSYIYRIINDRDMSNYTFRTTITCTNSSSMAPFKIELMRYKKQAGTSETNVLVTFAIINPAAQIYGGSSNSFQSALGNADSNDWFKDENGNYSEDEIRLVNHLTYDGGKYAYNTTYAALIIETGGNDGHYVAAKPLHYKSGVQLNASNYDNAGNSDMWNNISQISVFVAKFPDELKIWVAYGNGNMWLDGVIPTTDPTIDYKLKNAPSGYTASLTSAFGNNTRLQFYFPKEMSLQNTYITDLGVIEKKPHYEQTGTKPVLDHYEDIYGPVTYYDTVEEPVTTYEYVDIVKDFKVKNDYCLYHKIDSFEPDSNYDIYIGSVYIRQNTSLHSTVLVDSRTRGGGVLTSISDGLRHELEAESDYYLDIGYYDGEPYQENGVIIVRIDRRVLKDFGGYFTPEDVDKRVKRWLGLGVLPIIEFVDTYGEKDLPQHTLEIEDTYTNITDDIPEFTVECVEI